MSTRLHAGMSLTSQARRHGLTRPCTAMTAGVGMIRTKRRASCRAWIWRARPARLGRSRWTGTTTSSRRTCGTSCTCPRQASARALQRRVRRALIAEQARDAAANRSKPAMTRSPARKDSTVQLRAQRRQPTAAAPRRPEAQEARPEWAQELSAYQPPAASNQAARTRAPRVQAARTKTQAFHPATAPAPQRDAARSSQPPILRHAPARGHIAPQHFVDLRATPAQPTPARGQHAPSTRRAPALANSAPPALRQPPLRLLSNELSATPSALDAAEFEPQSVRALWVRSLVPGSRCSRPCSSPAC